MFKSCNKTLPFYLNGQGMCLPGCFEDVDLKGVCFGKQMFGFPLEGIALKIGLNKPDSGGAANWTGWVDGPEEKEHARLLNLGVKGHL